MDVLRGLYHIAILHGLIEYRKYTSKRCATKGDKAFGGMTVVSGALIGAICNFPIGAGIGAIAGYFAGKATIMSIENSHDLNQWFKYKCPNFKCGCEWKEKIHTMIQMIQVG